MNIFDLSKHSTTMGTCCILILYLSQFFTTFFDPLERSPIDPDAIGVGFVVAYTVLRDPAESKGSEDMVQRGGLFDDERCLGCYVQCGKTVKII